MLIWAMRHEIDENKSISSLLSEILKIAWRIHSWPNVPADIDWVILAKAG